MLKTKFMLIHTRAEPPLFPSATPDPTPPAVSRHLPRLRSDHSALDELTGTRIHTFHRKEVQIHAAGKLQ